MLGICLVRGGHAHGLKGSEHLNRLASWNNNNNNNNPPPPGLCGAAVQIVVGCDSSVRLGWNLRLSPISLTNKALGPDTGVNTPQKKKKRGQGSALPAAQRSRWPDFVCIVAGMWTQVIHALLGGWTQGTEIVEFGSGFRFGGSQSRYCNVS